MEKQLDVREKQDLIKAMAKADVLVHKKYMGQLQNYDIVPISQDIAHKDLNEIARFYKLNQFVYDKSENTRNKLISVFQAVAAVNAALIILIDSNGSEIEYYVGVRSLTEHPAKAHEVLYKSLSANFPGITLKKYDNTASEDYSAYSPSKSQIDALSRNVFKDNKQNPNQERKITCVTGIAGLRSETESVEHRFIQGFEKVIDAMRGERYSLVLIAEPVPDTEVQRIQRAYENLYSALKPFETTDLTYGENENESLSQSYTRGITDTINNSITNTITKTEGKSYSTAQSESDTKGFSLGLSAGIGMLIPVAGLFFSGSASVNKSHTSGTTYTEGTNSSISNAYGTTEGASKSSSETTGETSSRGTGSSRTLQIKFENKSVHNMMEKIDKQLKRLETAQSVGMWNCAAYCIGDNSLTSEMAAAAYYSVIRGEDSYVEAGAITKWDKGQLLKAGKYLEKLIHPIVSVEDIEVPAASFITTKELALHAGFPEKSVAGLPVKTVAAFGREVTSQKITPSTDLKLGKVYHMGRSEHKEVSLDKDSLTGHTFITGSTGSGKSNTVYRILHEAENYGCKFLVIEPAKGEYKHIFGNKDGVSVYGTNPFKSPLLKINPFKFPKDIHVLEHLDRLVEIFNVCWPMYAAMPAVLKKAVEYAYVDAGWDLISSTNRTDENLLPSFKDVVHNVLKVINESEYSEENKGNYKGALVTRLESLTNGINGMIFTDNDIADAELFDMNVIVDLSRVGSSETKSLIMGILVMKLQEYRMTSGKLNASLSHITVLEEAHSLLKRTSTEQSVETANLIGKSVEMLANSIAEMRTYGEGFIIADQSPGLLDMSVIRNTNTKIIMRIPDFSDRELVGKAAGLNDDQIIEIGKLPLGVAAVYQNDWIEPVLCKVEHYDARNTRYEYSYQKEIDTEDIRLKVRLTKYLLSNAVNEKIDEDVDELKDKVLNSNLLAGVKRQVVELLDSQPLPQSLEKIRPVVAELFYNIDNVVKKAAEKPDIILFTQELQKELEPSINEFPDTFHTVILQCIINEIGLRNAVLKDLPYRWHEFIAKEEIK